MKVEQQNNLKILTVFHNISENLFYSQKTGMFSLELE